MAPRGFQGFPLGDSSWYQVLFSTYYAWVQVIVIVVVLCFSFFSCSVVVFCFVLFWCAWAKFYVFDKSPKILWCRKEFILYSVTVSPNHHLSTTVVDNWYAMFALTKQLHFGLVWTLSQKSCGLLFFWREEVFSWNSAKQVVLIQSL